MDHIVAETLLTVKFSSFDYKWFSSSRRKFFLRRFQRLPLATRLLFLLFSEFLGLNLAKITADSACQGFSVFHNDPKAAVLHVVLLLAWSEKLFASTRFEKP